jgi:multiple sugar transport system permease protein
VTAGTEAPRARTPEPGRPGRKPGRPLPTRAQRDARAGRLLLSPTLLVVLVVVVVPIVWSIALAFQDLRLIDLRRRGLVGPLTLDNLGQVFGSAGFWQSLGTTLLFSVVGTIGSIGIGLIAALSLRRPFRGRTAVRASMLLPYVAPVVAVTFVWQTMLNPQFGILNHVGRDWFGWADPVAFLSQRSADVSLFGLQVSIPVALLSVMAFETWRYFPFAFLFLTARLHAVPGELEEAARVDGATPTQRFRHILLPQLMPVIALLAVLRFIFTFNEFDDIFLLTGGAAGTEVVSVRVFNLLTARGDIGGAAAQALVLALVLVAFLLVYFRFFARRVEEA